MPESGSFHLPSHVPPRPAVPSGLPPGLRDRLLGPAWHRALGLGSDRDIFPRDVTGFAPPLNRRWERLAGPGATSRPRTAEERAAGGRPWWWRPPLLGPLEMVVMLAVLRIGDCANGVMVREELWCALGEVWSKRTIYTTLKRVEDKQYVHSRPRPWLERRGPHTKRHVVLTALGLRALRRTQTAYAELAKRPFRLRWV